ncbi:protein NUCLEAR FUSION DEFECTIVE 6, chloroplastic/mitochondrial-like isoform X2 [Neltuma alba]|uniref:protein NUCLEAR FUSION DEFECTIVE 6, chloroplastic/mitochondrial-like isoform X2 n=1 Tax=Neltuma alba TaxID=207710 RepID=UPI0010A5428C|nr:protein NUCLEAR FUSION DEFECTIVE 6, chloroplastic/mitochondrial-like isoform X2 [Prosopis alba]XP_028762591.1 protein NUCLEAR FUSION DEFECTIVE 6, chloroplastic/mitochondrial-like isoform X2 [Prosopis alba]XP_028798582.1 protein NUCLEAR FUSION DEFECTIVE 6, chloroplastic/mitochondrial-like isoform X2 [Prosopis alba]XP_028798583.1 protein NUCLEAR FUSION DEFECTIVE 6, chloroplastic/mitochondrial-like isoform X2 [Prosopis alba]
MASGCSRIAQRTFLASAKSAIKSNLRTPSSKSAATPASPIKSTTSTFRKSSLTSRIAPELGCLQSMLPLHSAVAAARMTSCLSITSRSCRALSQDGIDGT